MDPPSQESPPSGSRPRMFGGHLEPLRLPWDWASTRLQEASRYWIATTRPDGKPHSRPVWGVWREQRFFFSTSSLAAANLVGNPEITVHIENESDVVIVEGTAVAVSDQALIDRVMAEYNRKYRWDVNPRAMPGTLYVVVPRLAFGWIADDSGLDRGATFHGTATRWRFEGH